MRIFYFSKHILNDERESSSFCGNDVGNKELFITIRSDK